jgi:ATP-dependent DNA ligase
MVDRPVQIGIMKATPLEESFVERFGSTCFAQRKFRGQRARVQWIDKEPILISSYGNAFHFLPHITEALRKLPALSYDGELYDHSKTQQQINSVLGRTRNPHPEADTVCYQVFDLISDDPQYKRFMFLDQLFHGHEGGAIRWSGFEVITPERWPFYAKAYIERGYEGIILRALQNRYRPLDPTAQAQRPRDILKFKPREKDTYRIIEVLPGTGWCEGMAGSFLVEDDNGVRFRVGTGRELTKDKRQKWWALRDELPGRSLVVKHEPITTADGIPICTSAYEVRKRC